MAESVALRPQDALVTTSLDGRVLGWSRGAQALFGWKEREILDRPLADLLHEKHQAVDAQNLAEVAGGATVRDTVVKYVRRDQVVLRCLQTMLPLCDMAGRVNGTARLIFDLSALEEAERALRQMVAQVRDLAAPAPAMGGSELLRMVAAERERTRRHYLDIVGGECDRLHELLGELVAELAAAGGARFGSGAATTR
ncbi:MAG: PAS domain S-box protein [Planctomycetes bacterium]|nr:PAS domain S-box protein [Planctomycetota bacterium]